MAISTRLRYEILKRDGHTCRYCGARPPDAVLTVDHVTPTALGGTDDPSNLVAACKDCNAGKSASSPDAALVADVSADALRWAAAIRQAADEVTVEDEALQDRLEPFLTLWDGLTTGYRRSKPQYRLPDDWESAVVGLMNAGLPDTQLLRAAEIALTSRAANAFRYFLGVANNMLADLHERARRILEDGDT